MNKIKIKASLDIAEKRLPQDGRIFFTKSAEKFDIRVSVLPTLYGEKIVLRLLSRDTTDIDINTLGFQEQQLEDYLKGIQKPHGIILISGPTGSGKTTLIKTILGFIPRSGGEILLFGKDLEHFKEHYRIGYVPQRVYFEKSFPINVTEIVSLGLVAKTGILHQLSEDDKKKGVVVKVDLDGIQLIQMVKNMRDEKKFLCGDAMEVEPRLFIGAAENPFADPFDYRAARLGKKIAAGADFIQTQIIFNVGKFAKWMEAVCNAGLDKKVKILAGVAPIKSIGAGRYMQTKVPGMDIPEEIITRLKGVPKRLEVKATPVTPECRRISSFKALDSWTALSRKSP
jgi:hypothetical protein